jgi:aspartyl-tRNA(Asn)/glutamyl-tRNA(Gln) amidotransferase subunit B
VPTAEYEPVIGLEVHAQLLTATKIFCGCSTAFGAPPNTNVCAVCLGLPGALPVLNRRAVELAVRAALALGCSIHARSIFARKNYFYPDLPKGYQISQYERPFATGGRIPLPAGSRTTVVGLTRIHMEEDAGKSLHHGLPDSDRFTALDFNRSGVPLIEIVTEPDLRSPGDAADCFARLREILVALGANDGNMEEGSLRCDANVSIRPIGSTTLGTKTEIKNVNSFRYVQKAIEFEIERQVDVVRKGGTIRQETRLWDSEIGETTSMRSKEEAHDYRYFPEPDLPPLEISSEWVEEIRRVLPELPEARKARYVATFGLSEYDADVLVRAVTGGADYFEAALAAGAPAKPAANWIQGEIRRRLKEGDTGDIRSIPVPPERLAELVNLADQGTISSTVAKDVFDKMWSTGRPARDIIEREGLAQMGDESALRAMVNEVVAAQPDAVAQYRAGRTNILGFLVGLVMKASQGKANPKVVNELLRKVLEG